MIKKKKKKKKKRKKKKKKKKKKTNTRIRGYEKRENTIHGIRKSTSGNYIQLRYTSVPAGNI